MSVIKFLANEKETADFAAKIAKICKASDVILLYGEVGAGKTTFARGFIQSIIGANEEIASPTFTLVQSYIAPNITPIYHCDLYRLKHESELEELGLDDAFESAITLIEWAELIENQLPDALKISIKIDGDGRSIELKGSEKWQEQLKNL